MSEWGPIFYDRWRRLQVWEERFREHPVVRPRERLLQAVWARQRILRDDLSTETGTPIRVLHPGFWNREPGPDFRGALIQFGEDAPIEGDVEVDLQSEGWRGHGHDRNPAFAGVILHVIWEMPVRQTAPCPTLVLRDRLDASLDELEALLDGELPPPLADELQGRCSAPLRGLTGEALRQLLKAAARIRLEQRASQLRARARQGGWNQALIEGLFRALGYKHNAWPMQRLGELVPRMSAAVASETGSAAVHEWQAVLLGCGGLLPPEPVRIPAANRDYLRRLWDIWWRLRDDLADQQLPRHVWQLAGIRPANHPHRRLALAAHWLAANALPRALDSWFGGLLNESGDGRSSARHRGRRSLLRVLDPGPDGFWSRRWTLNSRIGAAPQPLLGAARATDLAVNVILPWFLVRSREGRNENGVTATEQLWLDWPAAEDNAVLRLARARLLGNAQRTLLGSAAEQQGLLQILRDFCDHSNACCDQCRFPRLLAQWREDHAGGRTCDSAAGNPHRYGPPGL